MNADDADLICVIRGHLWLKLFHNVNGDQLLT